MDLFIKLLNLSRGHQKQTVVSHSSTEAKLISLDTGLRMEGISCVNVVEYCDCRTGTSCHSSKE